jgi:hypothetical protein
MGSGIHVIIVDMDSKQYIGRYFTTVFKILTNCLGLGQYLSEIDPQHQDITWHLQHIIVFCRVHFQRSILEAFLYSSKKQLQNCLF